MEMKVNSIHSVSQVRNYVVFMSLETTDFVITIGLECTSVNMILTRLKIQFRSIISDCSLTNTHTRMRYSGESAVILLFWKLMAR